MKVVQAYLSWELPDGTQHILYTSLRAAKKDAKRLIQDEIDNNIENAERYGVEPRELDLKIEFHQQTVVKITREAFCQIINSNGGSYVVETVPLGNMEKHWRKPLSGGKK